MSEFSSPDPNLGGGDLPISSLGGDFFESGGGGSDGLTPISSSNPGGTPEPIPGSNGFAGGGSLQGGGATPPQTPSPPVVLEIKPGDITTYFAGFDVSTAVLRVTFNAFSDPYDPTSKAPYINGFFGIVESDDKTTKSFIGFFETSTGGYVRLIGIPLVGQSLGALVKNINAYSIVHAEVLNDASLLNSSCLETSPPQRATGIWSFFFKSSDCLPYSTGRPKLLNDIKFYLTSIEPDLDQSNPTQSLGGFVSPTQLYDSSVLSYAVSFYDTFLIFQDDALSKYSTIQMGDEIIAIDKWDSNKATVLKRSDFGTPIRFHPEGTIARGLSKSDIFDGVLSKNNTQYRCIAVKNTSSSEIARDVRVYFRLQSRNELSDTRLAVEIPRSEYAEGSVTDGTAFVIVVQGFAGVFPDDYFVAASLTFTTGQNASQTRIVKGFQSITGKITLEEALPFAPKSGDVFHIDAAPSQILQSGTVSPSVVSQGKAGVPYLISDFSEAGIISDGISINVMNKRIHGTNLYPKDVVYVWIERMIFSSNEEFLNSRAVLSVSYSRV